MNDKPREEQSYKNLYPGLTSSKKLTIVNPHSTLSQVNTILVERTFKEKQKEKDLNAVSYSATYQDISFLSTYSANNITFKNKYEFIAINLFELVMDRILKEWRLWQMKTIKLYYTNCYRRKIKKKCVICTIETESEDNIILVCNGCNMNVHQECYGVPNLEKYTSIEDAMKGFYFLNRLWFCRKCLFFKDTVPKCKYCNVDGNAYKQVQNTKRWGHILCVKFIETLSFSNMVFMEPIEELKNDEVQVDATKPSQSNETMRKTCFICNYRKGSVIKCAYKLCDLNYHVTCGINALFYFDMKNNISYCQSHDPEKCEYKSKDNIFESLDELKDTALGLENDSEFINLKHIPEIRKREPIFIQEQTFIHKVVHFRPRFTDFIANRIICNDLCVFNDRLIANFALEIGMFWNVRNNRYYEVDDIFSLDGYNWKKWDESRDVICIPAGKNITNEKAKILSENTQKLNDALNNIKKLCEGGSSTETKQNIFKKFQTILELKCPKIHIKTYGVDLNDELKRILTDFKEIILTLKNKEKLKQETIRIKLDALSYLNKENWRISCILKELRSDQQFNIFENPVTEKIAPDYFKIIKKPKCFKDIETMLYDPDYHMGSFEHDIEIIVNNCRLYNARNMYLVELSNKLENVCKDLVSKYQDAKLSEKQIQNLKEVIRD